VWVWRLLGNAQQAKESWGMSGHPLYLLAFLTFFLVLAFFGWSKISTKRSQQGKTSGLGGPNDPLA